MLSKILAIQSDKNERYGVDSVVSCVIVRISKEESPVIAGSDWIKHCFIYRSAWLCCNSCTLKIEYETSKAVTFFVDIQTDTRQYKNERENYHEREITFSSSAAKYFLNY